MVVFGVSFLVLITFLYFLQGKFKSLYNEGKLLYNLKFRSCYSVFFIYWSFPLFIVKESIITQTFLGLDV